MSLCCHITQEDQSIVTSVTWSHDCCWQWNASVTCFVGGVKSVTFFLLLGISCLRWESQIFSEVLYADTKLTDFICQYVGVLVCRNFTFL